MSSWLGNTPPIIQALLGTIGGIAAVVASSAAALVAVVALVVFGFLACCFGCLSSSSSMSSEIHAAETAQYEACLAKASDTDAALILCKRPGLSDREWAKEQEARLELERLQAERAQAQP